MFRRGAKSAPASTGKPRRRICALESLENRRLLSANPTTTPALINNSSTPGAPGYTPAQVLHAYGFDTAAATIGAVGGDGSGQTIAIIDAYHSPSLLADVHQFDLQFAIPDAPSLKEVDQNGGAALPATNAAWGLETTLDVEWAHAVAPGANIIVVEAKSAQLSDLLTAVDTARHFSDVSVVSMSWGANEFSGETAYDNILTTPLGHQSVTFIAAVGDKGPSLNVQWPAASPDVVAVGGSTLTINTVTTPTGVAETTYSGALTGLSAYESSPKFQTTNPTADGRSIPDVVYNANPEPGFSVYDSSEGGWQTLGGTSAGAPQWAALVAIADQVRASAGNSTLDGASQTLPALYMFSGAVQDGANAIGHQIFGASTNGASGSTDGAAANVLNYAGQIMADGSSAVALTSADGSPQASQVINALASTKTKAQAPAGATASTPAQPTPPISKLKNKKVHPFFLYGLANLPRISAAPTATPAVVLGGLGAIFANSEPITTSTRSIGPASALTSSITASPTLNVSGPSIVVEAMTSAATLPGVNNFSQAMAALYHSFPRLGENEVVPVTEAMNSIAPRASFYIAHINVAATFGDSIAAFINDCAERPRMLIAVEDAPHDHLRAWAVTIGVVALDALILGYLASRRHRRLNGHGIDRWWDNSTPGVEIDERLSLP